MLRVAAVAQLICDRWSGPSIDRNSITVTCLLHDVGNIVKANYDDFPILFPEEMQDLSYWKAVQGTLREKYGDTDQAVTLAIARELGLNARVIELLQAKTFLRNIDTAAGTDWEAKICAYADQRVGPTGVLTLSERMSEARRRYRGVPYATVNDPRFIELQQAGRAIENQVLGQSSMSGDDISDLAIEPVMRQLRSFVL